MKFNKRAAAGAQLTILLVSLFAFAFIIGGAELASAVGAPQAGYYQDGANPNNIAYVMKDICVGCSLGYNPSYTDYQFIGTSLPSRSGGVWSLASGGEGSTWAQYTWFPRPDLQKIEEPSARPITETPAASPAPSTTETPAGADTPPTDETDAPITPVAEPGCQGAGCNRTVTRDFGGGGGGSGGIESLLSGGNLGSGLLEGLQWGAVAAGAGYLLAGLLGFNEDNSIALSAGLGAGAFAYSFAGSLGLEGLAQLGVGLGVGAAVFLLLYRDVEVEIITFQCQPWQAPNGGNDCELCNDPDLPCSEYRCRSLGQNCELVNQGTEEEKCVNVNPYDVDSPIISPNENELTSGHGYTDVRNSPPGPGFRIVNLESGDGCLKAFTPLKFGVDTNEPAQCKIDFNHTESFDEMVSYMGGTNLYLYNHTEVFALPGAKAFENSSFILENGKDLNFFIRCKDKNGNENAAEYNIRFCMDPAPDTTAPQIRATSVLNGGCVAEESDTANVDFYTDEPAECRWSKTDQSYDNMPNEMDCSMNLYQLNAEKLFTCSTVLTGIARDDTNFYVRCKDQPGMPENDRNKNEQSLKFTLHGSSALKMRNLQPNGTIFGGVSPAPVELYAETLFGCDEGKAVCYYSTTGELDDYIAFFDTNNDDGIHTQRQDVTAGEHEYFIKCVDAGGNVAEDIIDFTMDIDTSAPVIARAYEENSMLKIVTVRDSECSYSLNDCDFTFEEGTEMPYANSTIHVAEWKNDETYFIKCRDQFRNEDADCSIIVRPSQNFL